MSWVGDANKYVVVSADSSVADAEDVRQFISCHLSKATPHEKMSHQRLNMI